MDRSNDLMALIYPIFSQIFIPLQVYSVWMMRTTTIADDVTLSFFLFSHFTIDIVCKGQCDFYSFQPGSKKINGSLENIAHKLNPYLKNN